ncbi:hypothetical protein SynWH8103_01364 [Synechococcus sp. WH 8103]|nr:hypothetical protein SynWH8103_01364 [Synechococcus sp. WH 8103]
MRFMRPNAAFAGSASRKDPSQPNLAELSCLKMDSSSDSN